jgi:pyruvate dehydrogenase E1 component alpha subunit
MEKKSFDALRLMMLIRAFETALAKRRDHGFQLLSTGEEAVAVGISSVLRKGDHLLTGGRSIGLALACGMDPRRLAAELLGKETGTNRGRGGRGHLVDFSCGFFGAHAVVGGNISIAAGVALAKQLDRQGEVVAIVFGDGACGAGSLHETLNFAAIWKLPLLFVCNNNQLSVSTPRSAVLAPARLSDLGISFGLTTQTVDGMDVHAVAEAARLATERIRADSGPAFLECLSERFSTHSTTARETRDSLELARIKSLCPIRRETDRLRTAGFLPSAEEAALEAEVQALVAEAFAFADASSFPEPTEVLIDVE